MKVVFEYMENFFDTESPFRKAKYYVYDLNSQVSRNQFSQIISDYVYHLTEDCTEEEENIYQEADYIKKLIFQKDKKKLCQESFDYFKFIDIEYTLYEALVKANYEVERSDVSRSLYVKLDNRQVRISDHLRPPVWDGLVAYDHHYDKEIITTNLKVSKKQLENVGIFLEDDEYYLDI